MSRVDETDFEYRRWCNIESTLTPRLLNYAVETLGPDALLDAWREFNCASDEFEDQPDEFNEDTIEEEFDPESPMNMLFMPWFLFHWLYDEISPDSDEFDISTIAVSFVLEGQASADEELLIARATDSRYSLCEVRDVKPQVGMTLFDLLRRVEYEVVERSASQTLKKGEIIYCATMQLGGISSNLAMGPYALPPIAKRDVLELREWIASESEANEITNDQLGEFEPDIRDLYLENVRRMFRPPQLVNTENDPLVPQKIYYEIESADDAFHALKDLAEGIPEADLRADATFKDELIQSAVVPWLGGTEEARKRLGGPVLLGTIHIKNREMVVEVNSGNRAERIGLLIDERLGERAIYKSLMFSPTEPQMAEMWQFDADKKSSAPPPSAAEWAERTEKTGVISLHDAPIELREKLKQLAEQHWAMWVEIPVPALNNMTPREAAKTEEGRDLLESLLLYYEHQKAKEKADEFENLKSPDVAALRRKLGMEMM